MENSKLKMKLGEYENSIKNIHNKLKEEKIIERIWEKDHTVWSNDPAEISNRLGWLYSPAVSLNALNEIEAFVKGVKEEAFVKVLLMGMGGSSLAPEVFSLTFGSGKGFPELHVLDSTDPDAVSIYAELFKDKKTLFIVSTKSVGTVENFSFINFFYNRN
jgi:glucose-6-phosphate isomerase